MHNWGSFTKAVYEDEEICNKLEHILPDISVKFKDDLCFKGLKVPYHDFTKVILDKESKTIIPLFLYKGDLTKCRVVNFAPLYCVGIGEVLLSYSKIETNILSEFSRTICHINNNITEDEVVSFLKLLSYKKAGINNEFGLDIAYSLRYGSNNFGQAYANRIIRDFYYYYLTDDKDFCKVFFDFMFFYFTFITNFIMDLSKVSYTKVNIDTLLSEHCDSELFTDDVIFKNFSYKTPSGNTKYISDGRGLGINALNILVLNLVKSFAPSSSLDLHKEENIEYCNNKFFKCLGDDTVAKFILGDHVNLDNIGKSICDYLIFNLNKKYTLDSGKKVLQEGYEEEFLFRKAYGVAYTEGLSSIKKYRDCNMHYFGYTSMIDSCTFFALHSEYTLAKSTSEVLKEKTEELKDEYGKKLKALGSKVKLLTERLEESDGNTNNDVDAYKKQVEDLQNLLASKQDIIDKLVDKNKSLQKELNSYFDESTVLSEMESEDSVSLEEMLDALNGMSYLLLGGRVGMNKHIEEKGLTGVTQIIDDVMFAKSSTSNINADFIIICTSFVSHQLVRTMQERYKNQLDTFIYFNGTNVDALIKTIYNFVIAYMN